MTRSRIVRLGLDPESGVDQQDGRFIATGAEPWLAANGLGIDALAGRFLELTYRASWWDEPVRPVFRFWQDDGRFIDRIAAGPIAGAGVWTGRVPPDARRLSISPTCRPGSFDFVLEAARTRRWPALLYEGFRSNPKATRSAILTRLIGWKPESDVNLAWATAATPLACHDAWRARRERAVDLAGLDRPRFPWDKAAPVHVIVTGADDAEALARTVASLEAQLFSSWRATLVGGTPRESRDSRATSASFDTTLTTLGEDDASTLTGVVMAGDRLVPQALAYLAEQARRHPTARLFYGDERQHFDGRTRPYLKPGWSPRLEASRPYVGRSAFVRGMAAWSALDARRYLLSQSLPVRFIEALAPHEVMPLRRVLVETATRSPAAATVDTRPATPAEKTSIIVPTRDHPALLRRVIASIRARSRPGSYEVVIVDNGSVTPEAKALLADLRQTPDVRVLEQPGPFNFSLMCNEAVAASSGAVLLFLNDDTEVLSAGWLDRLSAYAMTPTIGAVSARLTYPDGRLQHVGVLVGMGESAGHFGALAPGDDPGWSGRNAVPHEVSAVTGACLAVAREKFEAVGGFDALHLPVELSDIDLCLKLNERGFQTIVDPTVRLMHEESVSRGGATLRRLDVYGDQRKVFIERWRHVLRDDPAFHPGLSLYRWQAALG